MISHLSSVVQGGKLRLGAVKSPAGPPVSSGAESGLSSSQDHGFDHCAALVTQRLWRRPAHPDIHLPTSPVAGAPGSLWSLTVPCHPQGGHPHITFACDKSTGSVSMTFASHLDLTSHMKSVLSCGGGGGGVEGEAASQKNLPGLHREHGSLRAQDLLIFFLRCFQGLRYHLLSENACCKHLSAH